MRDSEVRVIIRDDFFFAMQGLSVTIGQKIGGRIHILRFSEDGMSRWEGQEETSVTEHPTMVLPSETLIPLLDALVTYHQGASDTRQIREDLLHERSRRDQSEDALRHIATAAATGNLASLLRTVTPPRMSQEEAKRHDHI